MDDEYPPSPSLFSHSDGPLDTTPATAAVSRPVFSNAVRSGVPMPDDGTSTAAVGGDH
ncbi:hypothetical protein [Nocardia alni]|uniref:hypothetical protein n=1 Tax=Nocardia alni TaxID=2815723 RepID=UPI001C22652F|nr:hypothetical protein [Nocardia alni]